MNNRKSGGLYPVREDPKIDAEIRIVLTTVCIKAGVVRVPHRHRAIFAGGDYSFELNGLPVPVEYRESGELIGLRDLLREADIKPNDALIVSFTSSTASLSFAMRNRKAHAAVESPQGQDGNPGAKEQVAIRTVRKVRINTQQYYPLEAPLPSALVGGEEQRVGSNVIARRRHNPLQEPVGVIDTPEPVGEGGGDYSVSEDFERWIASSHSTTEVTPVRESPNVAPVSSPSQPASHSLAQAMEMIEEFISRPDTPAIIQTQKVADELSLDAGMCERVLERISEDHERVNRIRNGAYMVRQKRSTTKV